MLKFFLSYHKCMKNVKVMIKIHEKNATEITLISSIKNFTQKQHCTSNQLKQKQQQQRKYTIKFIFFLQVIYKIHKQIFRYVNKDNHLIYFFNKYFSGNKQKLQQNKVQRSYAGYEIKTNKITEQFFNYLEYRFSVRQQQNFDYKYEILFCNFCKNSSQKYYIFLAQKQPQKLMRYCTYVIPCILHIYFLHIIHISHAQKLNMQKILHYFYCQKFMVSIINMLLFSMLCWHCTHVYGLCFKKFYFKTIYIVQIPARFYKSN
eukprot:TRINITY_DN9977_c0_g1_i3.p1 TRINITY_DN9977_c0_g1~~TRINITY_DN9977_c0_g1_i3.p1  ORF type:complete len:261 (-),score=-25.96 TRINITY_DN9977_c0_g1_i3:16-798(-)